MQLIDLSVTLEEDLWAPRWARNRIKYQDHAFGRLAIRLLFGLPAKFLKTRMGWANEIIKLSTHGTTHLDAPWHYGPTSGGKPARTVDCVPLEWCYGNAVKLDMTHKGDGEAITAIDLQDALAKMNHRLQPLEIVLIHTGNDRHLGSREYFTRGSGVSAEATLWLLEQGVKLAGIDSWGWDLPLPLQARQARQSGRDDVFWQGHYVGTEMEYCHLERLTNLDKLPVKGFKIAAFPLKVKGGSAGPARVVGIIE